MTYSPEILEAITENEKHRECVSALDCHIAPKNLAVSPTEYECMRVQYRRPILAALIAVSAGLERIAKLHDCSNPRCPSPHHIGPQIARETLAAIAPKEQP